MTSFHDSYPSTKELVPPAGLTIAMANRFYIEGKAFQAEIEKEWGEPSLQPETNVLKEAQNAAALEIVTEVFEDAFRHNRSSTSRPAVSVGGMMLRLAEDTAFVAGQYLDDPDGEAKYKSAGRSIGAALIQEESFKSIDPSMKAVIDRNMEIADWALSEGRDPVIIFESNKAYESALKTAINPEKYTAEMMSALDILDGEAISTLIKITDVDNEGVLEEQFEREVMSDFVVAGKVAAEKAILKDIQRIWGEDVIEVLPQEWVNELRAATELNPRDILLYGQNPDEVEKSKKQAWYLNECATEGLELGEAGIEGLFGLRLDYEEYGKNQA